MQRIRARIGPLWPYLVLIAIPAAGFILPDLFGGHLLMSGDNVQQNYPLRVLAGSMIRHGQLPLWDRYIYSGTPLLADFNAGAFYPLLEFFVILPDRVAWIATEVALFAGIGIGMYVFVRALALSTVACLLAAITFAFSGTVLSQVNHVDMTEGFVAIPWMLLALLHIVRDGRWRWSVLLGVGFAVVILGGAPEAMLDEAILVLLYAALSAGLDRSRWWRVASRGAAGAALALSLAAIQWLPGIDAIANSQRSGFGSSFAATGSYPPADGFLALMPYLYGGYGRLNEVSFFSSYNLPEVGIYLGILPVVAMLVLWIPSWPSALAWRERRNWYLVGLVGVLFALGASTPLEHVFNAIPLYGHQRLQSRNMIDLSVALSILLAGWIDRARDPSRRWVTVDRGTALVPLGIVLAVLGLAITDPNWLISHLAAAHPSPATVHAVRQASVVAAGVCALAAALVWARPYLRERRWLPLATLFVLADLGFVVGTSQLVTPPPNDVVSGTTTVESYIAAHLAPGGRFAVYDPQGYLAGVKGETAWPDYNILAGLLSVDGYSAIVNQGYNDATETHTAGQLDTDSLAAGDFDDLDLQDILTVPEYFLVPLGTYPAGLAGVQPIPEAAGQDPLLPSGSSVASAGTGPSPNPPRGPLGRGQVGTWFFGEPLNPTRASVVFATGTGRATVRFGSTGTGGTVRWGPATVATAGSHAVSGRVPPGAADGLALQVLSGRIPTHQAVVTVDGRAYELGGALSSALRPGAWHQEGSVEGYPLFVRNQPPAPWRAIARGAQPAPPIDVLSSNANVETIRVQATGPLVVVRDVAYDNGWGASVTVNGGPSRSVPLTHYGLVQQVHLPPGRDVVTFRYRPTHFVASSVLSISATVFLIALAVVAGIRVRRRRLSPRGSSADPPAGPGGH